MAFEAQEKVFYTLAGNIAIHNSLNASAHFAAVSVIQKKTIDSFDLPRADLIIIAVEDMQVNVL